MALEPEPFVVPELIRTDRTAPDFGTAPPQEVSPIDIQEPELLTQIAEVAEEQIRGEIPEDVQKEVQKIAAEQGISTGVLGQAGDFLTAQKLGLTSLDVQQAGIQTGLQVAGLQSQAALEEARLQTQVETINQELSLNMLKLDEEIRQWEDRFLGMQQEVALNEAAQDLQAAQLISMNQQFMQGLVRDIAVSNAQNEIEGAQGLIDTWADYFGTTNTQIAQLMGLDKKLGITLE